MEEFGEILRRFGITGARVEPVGRGLINQTFRVLVGGEPRWVLQRVNPMFPREVNLDMAVVTERLREAGLETPVLLGSDLGVPWVEARGGVWRVMTWVPGEAVASPWDRATVGSAARLLARFHRACRGMGHRFHRARTGVHDLDAHLAALADALNEHRGHPMYRAVAEVGEEILARARELPALPDTPARVVHGDPKLDNVIFRAGEAVAMVDLDTVGPGRLPFELGDALRSWCNPRGEDVPDATLDLGLLRAAIDGYLGHADVSDLEREGIAVGLARISLELAARFCRDALEDRYFGWDPSRFSSRSEHDLVRARGQLSLHRSVMESFQAILALS